MEATLLAIARSGKTAPLEQIVEQNIDALSSRTPKKDTALHIAVRQGHCFFAVEIVKRCPSLLFAQNVRGDTALHIDEAASNGHEMVVWLLLREDPELAFLVNGAGASPLYLAAENGPVESVDHFISYSSLTGRRAYGGPHNRTPMHAAVLGGHLGNQPAQANQYRIRGTFWPHHLLCRPLFF